MAELEPESLAIESNPDMEQLNRIPIAIG